MCSSSNLSSTAQEVRGTTGIQVQSHGSSPACVVLELFILNGYLYLTFTYRYLAQITEVFSYQNLLLFYASWLKMLALPCFLSVLIKESSRSLADYQVH
jgi:hypothetical protein